MPASTAGLLAPEHKPVPRRSRNPPKFGRGTGSIRGGVGNAGMRRLGWDDSGSLHLPPASVNQRRFPASPRSNYTQDEAGNDTLPLINNSAQLRAG